jgi:hypothetical protein
MCPIDSKKAAPNKQIDAKNAGNHYDVSGKL